MIKELLQFFNCSLLIKESLGQVWNIVDNSSKHTDGRIIENLPFEQNHKIRFGIYTWVMYSTCVALSNSRLLLLYVVSSFFKV